MNLIPNPLNKRIKASKNPIITSLLHTETNICRNESHVQREGKKNPSLVSFSSIFPRDTRRSKHDEGGAEGRRGHFLEEGGYALKNPASESLARELVRNTSDGNERFAGRTGTRNVKWRVMRGREA